MKSCDNCSYVDTSLKRTKGTDYLLFLCHGEGENVKISEEDVIYAYYYSKKVQELGSRKSTVRGVFNSVKEYVNKTERFWLLICVRLHRSSCISVRFESLGLTKAGQKRYSAIHKELIA